jgi:hypothetical protein
MEQWNEYVARAHVPMPQLKLCRSRERKSSQITDRRGTASAIFARSLVRRFEEHEPDRYYVNIAEYGIWGSMENLHLYYVWRKSHHDFRTLEDARIHVAQGFETADVVSLVHMALVFGWGFALASDRDLAIHIDHDDRLLMTGTDEDEIDRTFAALGLTPIPPGDTRPPATP